MPEPTPTSRGSRQVTCIIPDGSDRDRRIDSIGGATGAETTNGAWTLTLDKAIAGIEDGRWRFWTYANGERVDDA